MKKQLGRDRNQPSSERYSLTKKSMKKIALVICFILMVGAGTIALSKNLYPLLPFVQSSDSPNITWSEPRIDVTLAVGQSTSKSITFASTEKLKKVKVAVSPQIAPFVATDPTDFNKVPANKQRSVQLTFSVPQGTIPGRYEGQINILTRDQSQLLQSLRVFINAGVLTYRNDQAGYQVLYPIGTDVIEDGGQVRFFNATYFEVPPDFELKVFTPNVDLSKSRQDQLTDIAKSRLGDSFVRVVSFSNNGVVVESDTIFGLHFFTFDATKNKAMEITGGSPDFLSTDTFKTVSANITFF